MHDTFFFIILTGICSQTDLAAATAGDYYQPQAGREPITHAGRVQALIASRETVLMCPQRKRFLKTNEGSH